jgi:hypothetical protein
MAFNKAIIGEAVTRKADTDGMPLERDYLDKPAEPEQTGRHTQLYRAFNKAYCALFKKYYDGGESIDRKIPLEELLDNEEKLYKVLAPLQVWRQWYKNLCDLFHEQREPADGTPLEQLLHALELTALEAQENTKPLDELYGKDESLLLELYGKDEHAPLYRAIDKAYCALFKEYHDGADSVGRKIPLEVLLGNYEALHKVLGRKDDAVRQRELKPLLDRLEPEAAAAQTDQREAYCQIDEDSRVSTRPLTDEDSERMTEQMGEGWREITPGEIWGMRFGETNEPEIEKDIRAKTAKLKAFISECEQQVHATEAAILRAYMISILEVVYKRGIGNLPDFSEETAEKAREAAEDGLQKLSDMRGRAAEVAKEIQKAYSNTDKKCKDLQDESNTKAQEGNDSFMALNIESMQVGAALMPLQQMMLIAEEIKESANFWSDTAGRAYEAAEKSVATFKKGLDSGDALIKKMASEASGPFIRVLGLDISQDAWKRAAEGDWCKDADWDGADRIDFSEDRLRPADFARFHSMKFADSKENEGRQANLDELFRQLETATDAAKEMISTQEALLHPEQAPKPAGAPASKGNAPTNQAVFEVPLPAASKPAERQNTASMQGLEDLGAGGIPSSPQRHNGIKNVFNGRKELWGHFVKVWDGPKAAIVQKPVTEAEKAMIVKEINDNLSELLKQKEGRTDPTASNYKHIPDKAPAALDPTDRAGRRQKAKAGMKNIWHGRAELWDHFVKTWRGPEVEKKVQGRKKWESGWQSLIIRGTEPAHKTESPQVLVAGLEIAELKDTTPTYPRISDIIERPSEMRIGAVIERLLKDGRGIMTGAKGVERSGPCELSEDGTSRPMFTAWKETDRTIRELLIDHNVIPDVVPSEADLERLESEVLFEHNGSLGHDSRLGHEDSIKTYKTFLSEFYKIDSKKRGFEVEGESRVRLSVSDDDPFGMRIDGSGNDKALGWRVWVRDHAPEELNVAMTEAADRILKEMMR